jgi:GT2 family glycosyltransferase
VNSAETDAGFRRRDRGEADRPGCRIDVVVVAYNSAGELRDAIGPLVGRNDLRVIVVDNASSDGSLDRVADLDVTSIARSTNDGFAAGCNAGWRAGRAPHVCFLNPDASLDATGLERLAAELHDEPSLGAVAPRIEEQDGRTAWSLRRFPRVRSTFARAVFLHRLLPRAAWTDDLVRDPGAYERAWSPDWVSGACVVVRREALDSVGGWDEAFFHYGEDADLCKRLRDAGWGIRFDPSVTVRHLGGRSAPRSSLLPVLAKSRLRYARKHRSRAAVFGFRAGLALGAATHALVGKGGTTARRGHLAALAVTLGLEGRRG